MGAVFVVNVLGPASNTLTGDDMLQLLAEHPQVKDKYKYSSNSGHNNATDDTLPALKYTQLPLPAVPDMAGLFAFLNSGGFDQSREVLPLLKSKNEKDGDELNVGRMGMSFKEYVLSLEL